MSIQETLPVDRGVQENMLEGNELYIKTANIKLPLVKAPLDGFDYRYANCFRINSYGETNGGYAFILLSDVENGMRNYYMGFVPTYKGTGYYLTIEQKFKLVAQLINKKWVMLNSNKNIELYIQKNNHHQWVMSIPSNMLIYYTEMPFGCYFNCLTNNFENWEIIRCNFPINDHGEIRVNVTKNKNSIAITCDHMPCDFNRDVVLQMPLEHIVGMNKLMDNQLPVQHIAEFIGNSLTRRENMNKGGRRRKRGQNKRRTRKR